jgi:ribosome biogenesis protein ERB1
MARATRSSASHAVLEKASGPAGRAPAAPKKDVKQVVKEESEDDEEVVTNSTEEESILDTGSEDDDEEDNTDDDEEEEDEFEDQGSSTDEDESIMSEEGAVDSDASEGDETEGAAITNKAESSARSYQMQRYADLARDQKSGVLDVQRNMHLDDLSSDDEEAEGNTIGRVPLHWYDAYDHIGYDVSGNKMVKRVGKDRIDEALEANASSKDAAHRTVFDMYNSREVVLSERDLEIIRRIQAGAFAHAEFNDTPDYIDYYTHEQEKMPISAAPEPKRRFVPSKWEMMRVMKIVKAIKEGRYVDSETAAKQRKEQEDNTLKGLFMVWNDQEDETLADSKRNAYHMPAPKIPLPGHAESYNPPSEYLLSEQEQKEMEELDPSERPYNFIPKQHKCLRHVGAYPNLVKERFERCLDLYLCPRQLKKRLNIDPESLIPRLPRPKELKPFPNSLCLQYIGHKKAVRCIAVSPDGQFLVSGSEDGTVMLWEVDCGLCRYVWDFKGVPVTALAWNPNPSHHVIAASVGKSVVFITTGTGDKDSTELTDSLLAAVETKAVAAPEDAKANEEDGNLSDDSNAMSKKNVLFPWRLCSSETMTIRSGKKVGPRVRIDFPGPVTHIAWHHRGDYFGVLCPNSGSQTLSIHQVGHNLLSRMMHTSFEQFLTHVL